MRRLIYVGMLALGLGALTAPGVADAQMPGVKKPSAPEAPEVPEMTASEMLRTLDTLNVRFFKGAELQGNAFATLLKAFGFAEQSEKLAGAIAELKAKGATDEAAAELVEVVTDPAVLEALVEASKSKEEMDEETKELVNEARMERFKAGLVMGSIVSEASNVGLAMPGLVKKIGEGDSATLADIGNHASDPKEFADTQKARVGSLKTNASAFVSNGKDAAKTMKKVQKKRKLEEVDFAAVKKDFDASSF